MIYKTDLGYVISSRHVYLPGVYETEQAARYAFRFPDADLRALSDRVCRVDGEHRNITTADLRALRAQLSSSTHSSPAPHSRTA